MPLPARNRHLQREPDRLALLDEVDRLVRGHEVGRRAQEHAVGHEQPKAAPSEPEVRQLAGRDHAPGAPHVDTTSRNASLSRPPSRANSATGTPISSSAVSAAADAADTSTAGESVTTSSPGRPAGGACADLT